MSDSGASVTPGVKSSEVLDAVARACSPRVARVGDHAVLFDANGLTGVLGPPDVIAHEVVRLAGLHGLDVDLALAGTMTAAWLLARSTPGVTVAVSGSPATAVEHLRLAWLATLPDFVDSGRQASVRLSSVEKHLGTFARWGLRTLGDIARLSRADLHARMGAVGVRLHQAANGEDAAPFVPVAEGRRFIERQELEWPIEGLEPLSFVLARMCDRLSMVLERADRGAIVVVTRLTLVTRATHERTLHLPGPMRDGKVLRTLIALDLESHPPKAGIDVVEIEVEVAPGRIAQASLFECTQPSPELLATLVARLGALMGESRVGAPALVDSHDPRAIGQNPFVAGREGGQRAQAGRRPSTSALSPLPCTRRFRLPVAARVSLERGRPVRVVPAARGLAAGGVTNAAGPWRSAGGWWSLEGAGWDRDEWDVSLDDGSIYRLVRDRATGQWSIDGVVD